MCGEKESPGGTQGQNSDLLHEIVPHSPPYVKAPIPTVDAYLCDGQLIFFCAYCQMWHYHGSGLGHRVAHCDCGSGSPYLETGYVLRAIGKRLTSRLKEQIERDSMSVWRTAFDGTSMRTDGGDHR